MSYKPKPIYSVKVSFKNNRNTWENPERHDWTYLRHTRIKFGKCPQIVGNIRRYDICISQLTYVN